MAWHPRFTAKGNYPISQGERSNRPRPGGISGFISYRLPACSCWTYRAFGAISYAAFLVPGLAMMALQQNAFANSSSSLTQSKVTGNLVFLLLTPLPAWSWFLGYVGGGVVRGLVVGIVVWLSTLPLVWTWPLHPGYALAMLLIAALLMSALGLLAGLWQ
jgi:ABC-2 type transport system permease protein